MQTNYHTPDCQQLQLYASIYRLRTQCAMSLIALSTHFAIYDCHKETMKPKHCTLDWYEEATTGCQFCVTNLQIPQVGSPDNSWNVTTAIFKSRKTPPQKFIRKGHNTNTGILRYTSRQIKNRFGLKSERSYYCTHLFPVLSQRGASVTIFRCQAAVHSQAGNYSWQNWISRHSICTWRLYCLKGY